MIKKANIQWTAKQLAKMADKGTISFENSVQRGYVWDNKRKSLFIHSMIVGYPIPPFYAAKNENCYDMLDGKQRSSAIREYLNDEFSLINVPEVETEDGDLIDVSNLKFSELRESLQDEITSYSLTVYYFDGITEDEISELFFRLNNGKPLSAIELTRVKAKSIDTIKRIGSHEIFNDALSDKAINKYTNEDITIKAWAILNVPNPSFRTKDIRPMMETADITKQQEQNINTAFTRIQEAYKLVMADTENEKINSKIAKRIFTRTHLISIVPIVLESINNDIPTIQFTEWLKHFFSGTKSATISEEYNINSSNGSGSSEAIRIRLKAIYDDYNSWFRNKQIVD